MAGTGFSGEGLAADMVIYNDEFWGGFMETIDQIVDVFNAASLDCIRLVNRRSKGEFQKESFVNDIASMVSRRDVADTLQTPATRLAMEQDDIIRPKLNRKIGPIENTLDSWKKIGSSTREMSLLLGQQVGQRVAQDMVDTVISAAVGAFSVDANSLIDVANITPTPLNLTHDLLQDGNQLMGDMQGEVLCYVMHSASWNKLMKDAMVDSSSLVSLDSVRGVAINEGNIRTLGRRAIVTDSPSLVATNDYYILGLKRNALVVMESEERDLVSEIVTGNEQLTFRVQGEFAYNVGVGGYSYTSATKNPDNTALATNTNWGRGFASAKRGGGFAVLYDSAA